MLAVSMFTWWYGQGWARLVHTLPQRFKAVLNAFSVGTLLRTLLAPWRRTITVPGKSLGEHFRALIDNIISRFVGLLVRLCVLVAALIIMAALIILGTALLIVWPLLPLAAVVLLVKGFTG